jgi:hypothetical protein
MDKPQHHNVVQHLPLYHLKHETQCVTMFICKPHTTKLVSKHQSNVKYWVLHHILKNWILFSSFNKKTMLVGTCMHVACTSMRKHIMPKCTLVLDILLSQNMTMIMFQRFVYKQFKCLNNETWDIEHMLGSEWITRLT